jgi:hypothetical protein
VGSMLVGEVGSPTGRSTVDDEAYRVVAGHDG